jgi:hypothetical protein
MFFGNCNSCEQTYYCAHFWFSLTINCRYVKGHILHRSSDYNSCFVFGRHLVQIPALRLATWQMIFVILPSCSKQMLRYWQSINKQAKHKLKKINTPLNVTKIQTTTITYKDDSYGGWKQFNLHCTSSENSGVHSDSGLLLREMYSTTLFLFQVSPCSFTFVSLYLKTPRHVSSNCH